MEGGLFITHLLTCLSSHQNRKEKTTPFGMIEAEARHHTGLPKVWSHHNEVPKTTNMAHTEEAGRQRPLRLTRRLAPVP